MSVATPPSPVNKTAVSFFLIILIFSAVSSFLVPNVWAQEDSAIFIESDGSIEGTTSIQRSGDTYTLTSNISLISSGSIQIRKSNIIIDGAGFTILGYGMTSSAAINLNNFSFENGPIRNVTVKNVRFENCGVCIDSGNSPNNTFYGNTLENCSTGISIIGVGEQNSRIVIMYNDFRNCSVAEIFYHSALVVVSQNNITVDDWSEEILMAYSSTPLVDKNYWWDYTTKYPNATEIAGTGIWNTPNEYFYGVGGGYYDEHPLVNPAFVEELPAELNVPTPTPKPTPTYTAKPTPTPNPTFAPTQSAAPTLTPQQTPTSVPTGSAETIDPQTPQPTQNSSPTNHPTQQTTAEPSATEPEAIGINTENYTFLTIIIGLSALATVLAVIYLKRRE